MYKDKSLKQYLDDLAARMPAPGGGSAAALTAALGASLISMVVNFTIGKPKYAQYEQELRSTLESSEKIRNEFLNLVDMDVAAYQSKDLKNSLNIPFMTARLCFEAIKLCPALIGKGNRNLISDVQVAAQLLESAFSAAVTNVDINLKLINDKQLTKEIRKELNAKEKIVKKTRIQTEEKIGEIIRG